MIIRIDRLKWLRSETNSYLLRSEDGKMCCLGQIGKSLGVPREDLLDTGAPSDCTEGSKELFPEAIFSIFDWSSLEYHLISINDTSITQDSYKERKIEEAFFNKAGIIIEFIN